MKQTAYEIEHVRTQLAAQGKLKKLKDTYSLNYPEIKNENTANFWDKKLAIHESLEQQDAMTQERTRLVAKFLPLSVKRVLDIGIGFGWVEELISKRNIELYGCDISPLTIRNINRKFDGKFSVQSIYNLTYKKEFFDAILLLEVLEHIPPHKTFKVLKTIHTLLKPNGYFILSVPTNEKLEIMPQNPSGHVRLYTIPLVSAELTLSGFTVITVKTLYAFSSLYTIKKFLAKILKKRWKPNNIIILAQKN